LKITYWCNDCSYAQANVYWGDVCPKCSSRNIEEDTEIEAMDIDDFEDSEDGDGL